jgi:SNF2 family DNA or RNA helicase
VKAENGDVVDIASNRVDSIMELIQDHSGKAIVFAPYPRLLNKITNALRTAYGDGSCVTFWGETKDKERVDARTRIQRDPETRFIVANQSVGGKGGTWTKARLSIFAANSWDQEDRQQSEFRNRRLGQTEHVHFVDVRARGTIEDRLISVLKAKRSMSAELSGDRWREWLA